METLSKTTVTVESSVEAPVETVWKLWTEPGHIRNWYYASEDWYAPYAHNDLKAGGRFKTTMSARDGGMGFDFEGVYTFVKEFEEIAYTLTDGRNVSVSFTGSGNTTIVKETFEAESSGPAEVQRQGWQAILDNFKKYVESEKQEKDTKH